MSSGSAIEGITVALSLASVVMWVVLIVVGCCRSTSSTCDKWKVHHEDQQDSRPKTTRQEECGDARTFSPAPEILLIVACSRLRSHPAVICCGHYGKHQSIIKDAFVKIFCYSR